MIRHLTFGVFYFVLACSMPVQAGIIDDFDDNALSGQWVESTVLTVLGTGGDPGTPGDVIFTETNQQIRLANPTWVESTTENSRPALQVVMLRDDVSLGIGQRLEVDLVSIVDVGLLNNAGIVVAAQKGITQREDFVTVSINSGSTNQFESVLFNGTSSAGGLTQSVTLSNVAGLFIERTEDKIFDVGYIDTSANRQTVGTRTYTGIAAVGNAVGFYADLRDSSDPNAILDNLRLVSVPEPSTFLLAACGILGLLAWKRQRRLMRPVP